MGKIGMEEGEPIEHRFVTRAIENAQKRVEAHNFGDPQAAARVRRRHERAARRDLRLRRQVLAARSGASTSRRSWTGCSTGCSPPTAAGGNFLDAEEAAALTVGLRKQFSLDPAIAAEIPTLHRDQLRAVLGERVRAEYARREAEFGAEAMARLRQFLMLQNHRHALEGAPLRDGLAQGGDRPARVRAEEPLTEYKQEAFDLFDALFQRVREEAVEYLFAARPVREEELPVRRRQLPRQERHDAVSLTVAAAGAAGAEADAAAARQAPRESRGGEGVVHTVRRSSPRSAATTPARAGAGRNTRSAAARRRERERPGRPGRCSRRGRRPGGDAAGSAGPAATFRTASRGSTAAGTKAGARHGVVPLSLRCARPLR